MTLTYGFYNSVDGDRVYNASELSSIFRGIINDGVFYSIGDRFIVEAGTGLQVSVGQGRAWFNDTWTLNDSDIYLTIDSADVLLPRIDSVVLEVDSTNSVRENSIKIVKGTPASTPAAPTLTNTATVHQYPLANVAIAAGASQIFVTDITQRVGTTSCPYVTGIVDSDVLSTVYLGVNNAPRTPEGRLTLTSNTPVTSSDASGTTIYYAPYVGDTVYIYRESEDRWVPMTFTQLTRSNNGLAKNTNYDVFIYEELPGGPSLSVTAWTNGTTRATELVRQNGTLVKSGSPGYLYLGTVRTIDSDTVTFADSKTQRYVWNMYHRLDRSLYIADTTDSWTYNSSTWRQVRATATNKVELVVGLMEDLLNLQCSLYAAVDTANYGIGVGVGEDSTSTLATGNIGRYGAVQVNNGRVTANAFLNKMVSSIGYHYYAWLESGPTGGNTATMYGDAGGGLVQSGMTGFLRM